jgi:ferredoxin
MQEKESLQDRKQENSIEIKLKEKLMDIIDGLELVIGYTRSNVPLRVNPLFIEKRQDIDNVIFNNLCINNLATYSYFKSQELKGKIGIVLKPCDVRSIVQLVSEELINKDKILTIVTGCSGVIDYKKIYKIIGGARIITADIDDNNIKISTIDENFNLNSGDFYADKCYSCKIYDNPFYYDEFIENYKKLSIEPAKEYEDVAEFEKKNLKEIFSFWESEFSRCIRCYACRNICPLEVCRDKCIAQLDNPHWQSQKIDSSEGKFFQLIRVLHLAGRCTECGECERICPVNIPMVKLMKKVNKDILKLFGYRPGYSIDAKPPLLTFKNVEENIKEENLVNE